jgi:hypothetical protein
MRFNEVVEIPRQCSDCPMLGRVAALYNDLEERKVNLLDYSTENQQLAISEIAEHEGISLLEAEEIYVLHEAEFRAALLRDHDELVQVQETEISLTHKMLLLCEDGILRMRATRNGTQVEVAVCMSEATRLSSAVVGFEVAKVRRKNTANRQDEKPESNPADEN